jgi:hypothetical protein
MPPPLLHAPALQQALAVLQPPRLRQRIEAALAEEEAYAADELVELAEELLHHLAAVGIAHYLWKAPQKEVYNDFLLQLFNGGGHDLNAGPLYRWAANMVRECPAMEASPLRAFFWERTADGREVLAVRVNRLSDLRNQVMHGFFVLPPQRNRAEAEAIGELLLELHQAAALQAHGDLHFLNKGAYSGTWNITEPAQWEALRGETPFGRLVERVLAERSPTFWEREELCFSSANVDLVPDPLKVFVEGRDRGAFACWAHPDDPRRQATYAAIGNWLRARPGTLTVAYALQGTGLSFTAPFMLERLASLLETAPPPKRRSPADRLKAARAAHPGQVVVLVDQVHEALFSPQHITSACDLLYENRVLLVATGQHHGHLDGFFNAAHTLPHPSSVPTPAQRRTAMHNVLRFKGPFGDRSEDRAEVEDLHRIVDLLCEALQQGRTVVARRFADEHQLPIEPVHEAFALLAPWVHPGRIPFAEDAVHELYGYPLDLTEASPIYLALGRRDLTLEYQHRILAP